MDLVIYQAIAAGLCGGITEVFKKAGLDSKFAPLSSLIIGLILGATICYLDAEINVLNGIIGGLMAGLGASGLYSGTVKPLLSKKAS